MDSDDLGLAATPDSEDLGHLVCAQGRYQINACEVLCKHNCDLVLRALLLLLEPKAPVIAKSLIACTLVIQLYCTAALLEIHEHYFTLVILDCTVLVAFSRSHFLRKMPFKQNVPGTTITTGVLCTN